VLPAKPPYPGIVGGLTFTTGCYADFLRSVKERPYHDICEVFDALQKDNMKVLMLLDGIDKPLAKAQLTRNLWDQLRELASKPSLRLVTASRQPLHELIRSAESAGSDFWNIFHPQPVKLECFEEGDIDDAISRLQDVKFVPGARTELLNWTAGFPPLLLELLNTVGTKYRGRAIDGSAVNLIAEASNQVLDALLANLWKDCPQSSRDLFCELMERGSLDAPKCKDTDVLPLAEKGFA